MIPPELVTLEQQAQQDVVTVAQRDLTGVWRQLDTTDGVAAREALTPIVRDLTATYGDVSAVQAADFYDEARRAAGPPGTFVATAAPTAPPGQVDAMTRWSLSPLFAAEPDAATALTKLSGGVTRLIRQAERDTVWQAHQRDPANPRYSRVPQIGACPFCLMLASRGGVYLSEDSATSTAAGRQYHDFCGCTAMPVWRDDDLPQINRDLQDAWQRHASAEPNPFEAWQAHVIEEQPLGP